MRAFIYDKYGYYPNDEFATSFEYKGWMFKLEITESNDVSLHNLRLLLEEINNNFQTLGSDIIMSRDGHYVSMSEYGAVTLIAVKKGDVEFSDLIKLHSLYLNKFKDKSLQISHLRNLWIKKSDSISERIIPTLPLDDTNYRELYVLSELALGLAENAIQYLFDVAYLYGNNIECTTLAHKRLDEFNSFYLFNPLNYVVDSPMRDFAELYKNNLIDIESLSKVLKNYLITAKEASLLMARCLFPNQIFDILEDYYELKKDITEKCLVISSMYENEIIRVRKLHTFLCKTYNIKPISWLE